MAQAAPSTCSRRAPPGPLIPPRSPPLASGRARSRDREAGRLVIPDAAIARRQMSPRRNRPPVSPATPLRTGCSAARTGDRYRSDTRHRIVPRISDAIAFARERQVLLLRHEPSGVTIEVSFAWLPFEEEALERAYEIDFQGVRLRVARAEDLIVYKAAAWRDRDRADIERLLVLHLEQINFPRSQSD